MSLQQHTSFSAWTTGVSNPGRYPCLRTSASVINSNMPSLLRNLSSIQVLLHSSRYICYSFLTLVQNYQYSLLRLRIRISIPPTYPLDPLMTNNASLSRITAAAGTCISQDQIYYFISLITFFINTFPVFYSKYLDFQYLLLKNNYI